MRVAVLLARGHGGAHPWGDVSLLAWLHRRGATVRTANLGRKPFAIRDDLGGTTRFLGQAPLPGTDAARVASYEVTFGARTRIKQLNEQDVRALEEQGANVRRI